MRQTRRPQLTEPRVLLLVVYLGLTVLSLLALAGLLAARGIEGFLWIQAAGHVSSLGLNFVAFVFCWLLAGAAIASLFFTTLVKRHLVFAVALTLIAFSYLNTTRESHYSEGDFSAYYNAAECVSRGVPINQEEHNLYLYPPLLATVLSPFVSLGPGKMMQAFRVSNYVAVVLLTLLLYRVLIRFRFSAELSALAVMAVMLANVPISRTLLYNQINIHVLNLILLSLLLSDRRPFWSALCLALAAHLKVSPVVLALPFLIWRRWRWCLYFALCNLLIIGGTSAVSAFHYYVAFVTDVARIGESALRTSSVDAFVYNTSRYLGLSDRLFQAAAKQVMRLALAATLLWSFWRVRDRPVFTDEATASRRGILNGFALLPILMVAVAPSIWPHHLVFLMLPLLVVFTALRTQWDVYLYFTAYLSITLMPVFDIYPFSYLRLAAIVLLLVLLGRIASRTDDHAPEWLVRLRNALQDANLRIVDAGRTRVG